MEQEFDYSLVDNNTADFLRSCEYEMNGIAEDARVKFGGVLKKVQNRLSNHHDGTFVEWYESGGMSKHDVYYAMNVYEISANLENSKKDNFLNAPKSLQKETMKKNAPEDLKQGVYDGDITTNKEYKNLLKQRDDLEQSKQQAESQAESERKERERLENELNNQEPKIKEIVKEVDNTDYKKIGELERAKGKAEEEIRLIKQELEDVKDNGQELEKLKEDLSKLYETKDDLLAGISVAKLVGEASSNINFCSESINNLMQPNIMEEIVNSPSLIESLEKEMKNLKEIMNNYDTYINRENNSNNIIDAKII